MSSCQDDHHHDAVRHPHGGDCSWQHGDCQSDLGLGHVQQDPLLHGHLQGGQEGLHQPLGHARGQGEHRDRFLFY